MAKQITLDPGLLRYDLMDNEGNSYSTFRINPTDMRLGKRVMEFEKFFKTHDLHLDSDELEEMARTEEMVQEEFNKLLGYDCAGEAFGVIGACTVLPDGSLFFEHLLDIIKDELPKVMEERAKKAEEHVEKYTKEYEAGDEGV